MLLLRHLGSRGFFFIHASFAMVIGSEDPSITPTVAPECRVTKMASNILSNES